MAKSYLTEKNLTIYQISDLLGYANEFHFSRSFKKHTKISPSAYRNSTKIGETIPD
jgi:AraC-like DNA-binding protein